MLFALRALLLSLLLTLFGPSVAFTQKQPLRQPSRLPAPDFLTQQRTAPRVREAYESKNALLDESLARLNLRRNRFHILLTAYKTEGELEVWAKDRDATIFRLLTTFDICYSAGHPGPKQYQGDEQVPEGLYHIDRFNPASAYHLSLGLNFPNDADYALSPYRPLGGDIFIHGDCVSVGCLPITDAGIDELYLYAIEARQNGQKHIPVYIFPTRMTPPAMATLQALAEQYPDDPLPFWQILQQAYDAFSATHREVPFTTDRKRGYLFR